MKRILVCMPTRGSVEAATFKSLWDMQIPQDVHLNLEIVSGYDVSTGRNVLVDKAINGQYDYTLWIDSDVIVPQNLLARLYEHACTGNDIVTGYYCKKTDADKIMEIFCATPADENAQVNMREADKPAVSGLYPVNGAGFGCILVKTDVFRKLIEAYPDHRVFEYVSNKQEICSEDLFFFRHTKEQGYQLMVDTSLRCGHIGQKIF